MAVNIFHTVYKLAKVDIGDLSLLSSDRLGEAVQQLSAFLYASHNVVKHTLCFGWVMILELHEFGVGHDRPEMVVHVVRNAVDATRRTDVIVQIRGVSVSIR